MKLETYPFTMAELAAHFAYREPQRGEKCVLCCGGIVARAWKVRGAWACGQCARRCLMDIKGMREKPVKLSTVQERALHMLWRQGLEIYRLRSDGSYFIQGKTHLTLYRLTVNALRRADLIVEIKGDDLTTLKGQATAAYRITPAGSELAEKLYTERKPR